jgi:hypothetical protein
MDFDFIHEIPGTQPRKLGFVNRTTHNFPFHEDMLIPSFLCSLIHSTRTKHTLCSYYLETW